MPWSGWHNLLAYSISKGGAELTMTRDLVILLFREMACELQSINPDGLLDGKGIERKKTAMAFPWRLVYKNLPDMFAPCREDYLAEEIAAACIIGFQNEARTNRRVKWVDLGAIPLIGSKHPNSNTYPSQSNPKHLIKMPKNYRFPPKAFNASSSARTELWRSSEMDHTGRFPPGNWTDWMVCGFPWNGRSKKNMACVQTNGGGQRMVIPMMCCSP